MIKFLRKENINKNIIYFSSMVISVILFIWGFFFKDAFESSTNKALAFITSNFSWFYMVLMIGFFVFCLYLLFSKYGNIKLGSDDSKPEFSNLSWFAMLFSAGIGIGLVFWGVAEPLTHFMSPLGEDGGTASAKIFALKKSFLHWGISAWACYASLALSIAYMHFRKGKPALISSLLIPLIGEKAAKGIIGKVVDILTIFATIAGIVTSLGLGTLQINSGLNYLFNIPNSKIVQVVIIAIITVLFLISASTGVKKGIKILSNGNMLLAVLLLLAAIVIGPTKDMILNLFTGLKAYPGALLSQINIFVSGSWYEQWTLFYWGWWIAWAPFVAIFIARVSKGRTIREFILGVLFVPAGFCLIWFSVFGTLGFNVDSSVAMEAIKEVETALFVIFNQYHLGSILSVLAILLLFTFFITSADSATFVLAMIASNGDNKPSTSKKIILGVIQSLLTIALLFAGGLKMIQTASIIMALPFSIIMLANIVAFLKELKSSEKVEDSSLTCRIKDFFSLKSKTNN